MHIMPSMLVSCIPSSVGKQFLPSSVGDNLLLPVFLRTILSVGEVSGLVQLLHQVECYNMIDIV